MMSQLGSPFGMASLTKKMFVDLDVKHLPGAIRYDLAYDSMISMSNFYTETFLRGAMRYDGTIHQVGSAKIDKLLTTPKDISIRRALGIPPECKIILYDTRNSR